ncbi:hypothetical protein [Duncaniella freteri]|uniref:hypothetical protein n=1 Tax=Duncaniella freteri TaxID=2530391 RepID=UPI00257424BE|nr:hypothetical protein [Duncaniella freteri]
MSYIELKKITVNGNRCEYDFEYPSEFKPYIADTSRKLYFELPDRFDITAVPEGILAVPFVGSVMCVSMLLGLGIRVPVLDEAFYGSIPGIKAAFKKMFPYADFCFDVQTNKITLCKSANCIGGGNSSLFFTGGIDATSAFIDKISEKPTLINIWGGDLLLTDTSGREALERYLSRLTAQTGSDFIIIKSSCRRFFNENNLEKRLGEIIKPEHNHGWWASIAHIISMTSAIAPLLYLQNTGIHYIGSSYPQQSFGFDANNVDMVDAIKIAGCTFKMVDENLDRSGKARKIIDYCKGNNLKVELKVCWYSTASENCCHCEKCYRTITEIISNHADPNHYGFRFGKNGYRELHDFLKYNYVNAAYWEANKADFLKEADFWKKDRNMSWILNFEFNDERRINRFRRIGRIKSIIWRIKNKVLG